MSINCLNLHLSFVFKNNTEETWTGRGKQPRWLVAELEKGAKLEDFLI